MPEDPPAPEPASEPSRREAFSRITAIAMAGGLAAGYGTAGLMAARFLYPARPRVTRWLFVTAIESLAPGESIAYRTPVGETVTIARQGEADTVESFAALSSTTSEVPARLIDVERTRSSRVESASCTRSDTRSSTSSGAAPGQVVRTVSVG